MTADGDNLEQLCPLELFLAREAQKGSHLDTSGFRIDLAGALAKLSTFALPDPGLWVVKLVQAAVAAGAPDVHFHFRRRQVEVRFSNAGNWQAFEILRALLNPISWSDSATQHLVTGLMAAAKGCREQVFWSCGGQAVTLDEGGPVLLDHEDEAGEVVIRTTRTVKHEVKPCKVTTPIRYLMKQTALEYKALVDRCWVSPIPVWIDGYRLPSTYQVEISSLPKKINYDSDNSTGRGFLFAEFPFDAGQQGQAAPYPLADEKVLKDPEESKTFQPLVLANPNVAAGAVACLYSCLQHDSRINFIMHGALVDSRRLFVPLSDLSGLCLRLYEILENGSDNLVLDLYVPVSWSDLDLSQFQVRERDLTPVIEVLTPELLKVFGQLRILCFKPWKMARSTKPSSQPINASVSGVFGSLILTVFIPHALFICGMCIVAAPLYWAAKPYFDRRSAITLDGRLSEAAEDLEKALQAHRTLSPLSPDMAR